jgi:hypothetical protein
MPGDFRDWGNIEDILDQQFKNVLPTGLFVYLI